MYTCQICNLFGGNSFASVLRHIGEIHRFDPGLVIRCGIEHCPQTYTNYESFRSHVYRKHRVVLHEESTPNVTETCDDNSDQSDASAYEMVDLFTSEVSDIKDFGAKFLIKVREEYRIPQLTLNKLINDVKGLWIVALDSIKVKLKKEVELISPAISDESLMKCFDDSFPLDGLQTEHFQLKYYKEHFNYLVSNSQR